MIWDVIVIGGGCAGLATGALLSHAGYRVLVLEKAGVLGGRAVGQSREGFNLNLGLHTPPGGQGGPLYRIVRRIGRAGRVRFVAPELNDSWAVVNNRLHRMVLKPDHLFTTRRFGLATKVRLMGALTKVILARPDRLWQVPLRDWVDTLTRDPAVQEFLFEQAMIMTFDPEPETLSAGHFAAAFRSVATARMPFYHIKGGWATIYSVLSERIREAGGEVRTGARVQSLSVEGGKVQETLMADGEPLRARAYVAAIPPQNLPDLLPPDILEPATAERLRTLESAALATLDLGLTRALPTQMAAVHSSADRMIVTSYTDPDTGMVPPGGQLLQALYCARADELCSAASAAAAHRRLAEFIERYYPGANAQATVRRTLVFRRAVTARHKVGQARPDLPGPRVAGVQNLFLAGDGTAAPGELSNAAWASAEAVWRAVREWL